MSEIKKYDYIDALRGVAILMVLFVHTGMLFNMGMFPHFFKSIQSMGARGVQLFFMMSALTLFMSYFSRSIIEKNTKRNFFIRRFFRIAPLYYIVLIVGLLYFGLGERYWLGDASGISLLNIISHFVFLSSLFPYYMNSILGVEWSIGVEMMFYLIIPFLAKRIHSTKQALRLFIFSILIIVPIEYLLGHIHPIGSEDLWNNFLFLWPINQLPVFLLGIVLYFVIAKNDLNYDKWAIFPLIFYFLFSFKNGRFLIYAFSIFTFFFILAVWKTNTKIIVNKFFIFIGKVSYSMYLIHIIILSIIIKYLKPIGGMYQTVGFFFLYYAALVAITATVSHITHNLVEKRGINLGKKIIEDLEK